MRQSYLVVKEERDALRKKLTQFKSDMDNLDRIVRERVNKALKTNSLDLKKKVKEQAETIAKLQEHNECFQETIAYLEE